MARPMSAPAPVVTAHAAGFRDLCDHPCQCRQVPHDLTGRLVWPKKRLANSARGLLDSADTTPVSRVLADAPWREAAVKRRRLRCMLPQTTRQRKRRRASRVVLDETLCAQVGSLVEHVDRHDHHREGTSPLAHHPVTSVSVSGPGRFPRGLRRYRRDAALTPWEACGAQHGPDLTSPRETTGRNRLPPPVDAVWLQAPACRARPAQFRTTMALAIALVAEAIRQQGPCGGVVCEAWYLAEDVVRVVARRRQDWSSRLTQNRRRETASVHRRAAHGGALQRPGPHLAVEARGPLIPAHAERPVNVREQTYGCCTLGGRIPGLGKGRLVVSFAQESWTGRSVGRVTHRVDWRAAKMISLSWQRWPTEPFAQDGQGPVGCHA